MRSVNKFLPACSRGNDPPCFSVCPFEFDIREFITKLQRGSFDGAFRLFRDAVFFPGIVTALCARYCMTVCSERNGGAPVNMSLLEKSSLKLARSIDPPLLNIPSKNQSAAIVGAGICGLTCALRLASMNYQVTVYEVNDRFGGHLWDLLPEDVFVGDIERQFQHVKYRLNLRRKIDVLPELEEQYDAIFVATGKGGNVFGLTAKEKPSLAFDSRRGIIMGGEVVGSDILGAISHGSKAATMMERYFKTGAFTEDSSSADSFQPNMSVEVSYLSSDRDCPAYSKEEAVFEAKRCSKCDCDKCYVSCPYMRHYKKYPERIATDAHETVNPSTYIVKSLVATRMIASCSDCGLCGQKCPENIHLGNLLMRARQSLVEQGNLPPPFHAFFMRDFEFANSDVAALSMPGKEGSPCRMTFFPGCQMGASSPALVRQAYAYLLAIEPSTGLLLRCCGVPAYWSGESGEFSKNLDIIRSEWERMGNPTLVTACPTCARMIRENLEDIPSISIYEIMSESPPLSTAYCSDETFSIFDPCASRYFP
ncbi:MAG: NAD(P)-binding protein, partial [Treponema sp.]|nr:NAD(P)-binding protein [Treponema sp.]